MWTGTIVGLELGGTADGPDVTLFRVQYDGYAAKQYEELEARDLELMASDPTISRALRHGERLNYALLSDGK